MVVVVVVVVVGVLGLLGVELGTLCPGLVIAVAIHTTGWLPARLTWARRCCMAFLAAKSTHLVFRTDASNVAESKASVTLCDTKPLLSFLCV